MRRRSQGESHILTVIRVVACRYDSFTGVPACQQNISLEKASILFNMGALYTQIGTRCNRQTRSGLEEAISAFQKAAGENKSVDTGHNHSLVSVLFNPGVPCSGKSPGESSIIRRPHNV